MALHNPFSGLFGKKTGSSAEAPPPEPARQPDIASSTCSVPTRRLRSVTNPTARQGVHEQPQIDAAAPVSVQDDKRSVPSAQFQRRSSAGPAVQPEIPEAVPVAVPRNAESIPSVVVVRRMPGHTGGYTQPETPQQEAPQPEIAQAAPLDPRIIVSSPSVRRRSDRGNAAQSCISPDISLPYQQRTDRNAPAPDTVPSPRVEPANPEMIHQQTVPSARTHVSTNPVERVTTASPVRVEPIDGQGIPVQQQIPAEPPASAAPAAQESDSNPFALI